MKFSCEKAIFQSAVNAVFRAAAQKSAIPALEGILVEAEAGVRLTAYNLQTGIRSGFECSVAGMGSVVIDAKMLSEIVRRLPDDVVLFTADENNMVNIRCGVSDFSIMGMSADDYPELPEVEGIEWFNIAQSKLKNMIAKTIFSVSESETRPVHTGELFDLKDGVLTIAAVDGYRLALRREECDNAPGGDIKFVVPAYTLKELEKILIDDDEPVCAIPGDKHIIFKVNMITVVSRLLEGEFLNYEKSVPRDNRISVCTSTRSLLSCVDRAALIISETVKSPVRLKLEKNSITIMSNSALGEVCDVCSTSGDGEGTEIGFNHRYLLDALKAVPDDEMLIELSSSTSPTLFLPVAEAKNWLYMVLPVRLR